jgi:Membrane protein involved in the export of O-antigen and teichoic acid
MAAGLVSFPILTRLLSVEEYGLLGLVTSTLALLVACGKVGFQQSIVRYYGEMMAKKADFTPAEYFSTVVIGMLGCGAGVTVVWLVVSQMIPTSWWNDPRVAPLFAWTSILVLIRVMDSAALNILRAQQRSMVYSIYSVVRRYAVLGSAVALMLWVWRGLHGFFAGTILAELAFTSVMVVLLLRVLGGRPAEFSPKLFRTLFFFGVPFIGLELAATVLKVGDRYVIQMDLGDGPLGVYSAAYNLSDYVGMIVVGSLGQAVSPVMTRIWEESGAQATREFVERMLHFYVLLGAALVAGLTAIGGELLSSLATNRYVEGREVIGYLMTSQALSGIVVLLAAGLYFEKNTKSMMWSVLAVSIFNLVLNIALVPRFGVVGSAGATVISQCVLGLVYWLGGKRCLPVRIPFMAIVKFGLIAMAMYQLVIRVHLANHWWDMAAKIAVGVVTYAAIVLAFDSTFRGVARTLLQRLFEHRLMRSH